MAKSTDRVIVRRSKKNACGFTKTAAPGFTPVMWYLSKRTMKILNNANIQAPRVSKEELVEIFIMLGAKLFSEHLEFMQQRATEEWLQTSGKPTKAKT